MCFNVCGLVSSYEALSCSDKSMAWMMAEGVGRGC